MVKPLLAIFIVTITVCCRHNTDDGKRIAVESRKIKMIMESVHDPILKAGKFESSLKPAKNSSFYESYFNQKGLLIRRNTFNSKAILQSRIAFEYDRHGNNTACLVYNPDGFLAGKKITMFDSNNHLIEVHEFDGNGKVISKKITTSDSAGYRTRTSYDRLNGRLVKVAESVFDSSENNVANHYFSNGLLTLKEIQTYDVKGNVLEIGRYYPLINEQTTTRFQYDEHNNKVGEIVLKNNLVTTKTTYRYDSKNNLTETYRYGVLGTIEVHRRYVFEFDADGNWTKRIELLNGRPISVSVRRLEYY